MSELLHMFLMLKMCLDKVSDVDIKFHKFMFAERSRYAAIVQINKSFQHVQIKDTRKTVSFPVVGHKGVLSS